MKMKRLAAWLLALVICFTLVACEEPAAPAFVGTQTSTQTGEITSQTEETTSQTGETTSQSETSAVPETETVTPLLYKVTDGSGNVVWLFGSIHVGRKGFYPLPDYVLNAFDGADCLAVEVDIKALAEDINLQVQALQPLLYTDGTTIEDHIPEKLYTKAVTVLEKLNSYSPMMDYYYPIFWSSLVDSLLYEKLGFHSELGVDLYLLERAYDANKEILEVESAAMQYNMLAGFSDELQVFLLKSSIETCADMTAAKAEMNDLLDLWMSGDEQAFAAYLSEEDDDMTPEEALLYEEYNREMIEERNRTMTDYAETALKSDKEVFLCVGAAHIVGEGGVAQLLAQRGYIVECMTQ